jgi:hypothetical protein
LLVQEQLFSRYGREPHASRKQLVFSSLECTALPVGKRASAVAPVTHSARSFPDDLTEEQISTIILVTPNTGEEYLTEAILDTGAQLNVISQRSALMWNLPRLEGVARELEMADNSRTFVYGCVGMVFRMRDA